MGIFTRKRKPADNEKMANNPNVNIADVLVITTEVISSYNDGAGFGPRCVTMYFLAKCENEEYYELFSGKKLEKETQSEKGFISQTFDTPYVKKAEYLTKYLRNPDKKTMDIHSLFDFITVMNVYGRLGAFSDSEEEEEEK